MEREASEIELLLPWHAAGTLNARDCLRVDEALARNPELAGRYAAVREEYAETIELNESLGAPSARAIQELFAAIDAESGSWALRSVPSVLTFANLRAEKGYECYKHIPWRGIWASSADLSPRSSRSKRIS